MFDTGNLKLLATQLPAGALERTVPGLGWTVRKGLAHLATSQVAHADSLEWLAAMSPTLAADHDDPQLAAARAAEAESRPLPAILGDLDSSLRRLVARLSELSEEALESPVGAQTLLEVLKAWVGHAASHAIQLLEALPELRSDPMLLNWLLYQDFSQQPTEFALQQRLFAEVRERYASEEDESEQEDGQ